MCIILYFDYIASHGHHGYSCACWRPGNLETSREAGHTGHTGHAGMSKGWNKKKKKKKKKLRFRRYKVLCYPNIKISFLDRILEMRRRKHTFYSWMDGYWCLRMGDCWYLKWLRLQSLDECVWCWRENRTSRNDSFVLDILFFFLFHATTARGRVAKGSWRNIWQANITHWLLGW